MHAKYYCLSIICILAVVFINLYQCGKHLSGHLFVDHMVSVIYI